MTHKRSDKIAPGPTVLSSVEHGDRGLASAQRDQRFSPEAGHTDDLWKAYAAVSAGGSTVWASLIQVVVFSIAAAGVIASAVVLALTSSQVAQDQALAQWLYFLLSDAWGVTVVLCGTYYLLTFGGMLRTARHTKLIECLLLDADPSIDSRTLFEHSDHIGRSSSVAGYAVAAVAALFAALVPQMFFHSWWSSAVGVTGWPLEAQRLFITFQVIWLIGFGAFVWIANRPAKCTSLHAKRVGRTAAVDTAQES